MARVEIIEALHTATKRDYAARRNRGDRASNCETAKLFGKEYWDGHRRFGYGGYKYDGRWNGIAADLINRYKIKSMRDGRPTRILDVGCGKGYLALALMQQLGPYVEVTGVDVSEYALTNAPSEVTPHLLQADIRRPLPFAAGYFDYVFSFATLHNLQLFDLNLALREIERVTWAHGKTFITVESWESEQQRANLLDWQLTCESFFDIGTWQRLFEQCGYRGDWEFMLFD